MLASATAAVFLVALSQTPGASALKLSQGPKSEAVDLQKEAKTLASVVQTAGSKIFQELKSNGTDSTIYEATEIRTLSAIIGRWLLLQNRVTSTRTPLSIAQVQNSLTILLGCVFYVFLISLHTFGSRKLPSTKLWSILRWVESYWVPSLHTQATTDESADKKSFCKPVQFFSNLLVHLWVFFLR